jgi:cytochrome c
MRASLKLFLPAALALGAAACGKPAQTPPAAGTAPAATAAASGAPDPDHGKILFAQCRSCHTVAKDAADMTGPNLHGLFGRKVASKPGYSYSAALRAQSFVWDKAHLDIWLTDPKADVPGTKMTFLGFPDAKDRADVIAYLAEATR